MERVDRHIDGRLIIEGTSVNMQFRVGSYVGANVDVTVENDADIDRAIDTACAGLAARLRKEYREARRLELEYRARITNTVETIANEPRS